MCSICGTISEELYPVSKVLAMLSKMQHRGPDSHGLAVDAIIYTGKNVMSLSKLGKRAKIVLGHSRLAIGSKRKGVQPVKSSKGRLILVLNGQIYNREKLIPCLKHNKFSSSTDAQIIANLIDDIYDGQLLQAAKRVMLVLDGNYAFAVSDGTSLVVARDPIGKNPVYFTDSFPFMFASERKALKIANRRLKRLLPGWMLEVSKGKIRAVKGCSIERPPILYTTMKEAIDEYEKVFDQAIDKRIEGIQQAGVLFSGGIDSLLVSQALKLRGLDFTCYCTGMQDSEDVESARDIASVLGFNLRLEYLTQDVVKDILPEVIESIEFNGPVQVEAAIPMYMAAKMCSEDRYRVMFSGQGADELFGGYSWYRDVVEKQGHFVLHNKMWDDLKQGHMETLEREDRVCMAHSLELRLPYLDLGVVRIAMMISPLLKVKNGKDNFRKLVHRHLALRKGVPHHLAFREKSRANDGTGIYHILRFMAMKRFKGSSPPEATLLDYGSNYRYVREEYCTPEMLAFLQEVTERNNIEMLATKGENIYPSTITKAP